MKIRANQSATTAVPECARTRPQSCSCVNVPPYTSGMFACVLGNLPYIPTSRKVAVDATIALDILWVLRPFDLKIIMHKYALHPILQYRHLRILHMYGTVPLSFVVLIAVAHKTCVQASSLTSTPQHGLRRFLQRYPLDRLPDSHLYHKLSVTLKFQDDCHHIDPMVSFRSEACVFISEKNFFFKMVVISGA